MLESADKIPSQSPVVKVLRWIAVLPGAALAWIAIQLIIILMNAMWRDGYADWVLQLVNSGASSYAFVVVGALIAPSFNRIVSIVLAILYGIAMVVLITAGFFIKTSEPTWWLVLTGLISIAAVIGGVIKVHEEL